jgi:hypothetical protein
MITSNDDVMALKKDEPILLSSSLNSHHRQQQHHHESSGYSSKEAECSSPENKAHGQHRHFECKSKVIINNNNHSNKTADIPRRRHRLSTNSATVLTGESLPIDDLSIDTNKLERTVR